MAGCIAMLRWPAVSAVAVLAAASCTLPTYDEARGDRESDGGAAGVASTAGSDTGGSGGAATVPDATALVGASADDDHGSAYVFVRTGNAWAQQQKLVPDDGAAGDSFGYSVSISGDTACVGAFQDGDNGIASGSAYVFVRSGTTWTQQQKLMLSDGGDGDAFGMAVSTSGDTAFVGADSGYSSYAFVRVGSQWTEQQTLTASGLEPSDYFGRAVALTTDASLP